MTAKFTFERGHNIARDVPENVTPISPPGTYGFISFQTLCTNLEESGAVRGYETITHLEIDERGIHFRLERKS